MIIALLLLFLLPLAFYSFRRTSSEMAELSDARLAEAAHTIATLIKQAGIADLRRPRGTAGSRAEERRAGRAG